jgi:hypothetical protein
VRLLEDKAIMICDILDNGIDDGRLTLFMTSAEFLLDVQTTTMESMQEGHDKMEQRTFLLIDQS